MPSGMRSFRAGRAGARGSTLPGALRSMLLEEGFWPKSRLVARSGRDRACAKPNTASHGDAWIAAFRAARGHARSRRFSGIMRCGSVMRRVRGTDRKSEATHALRALLLAKH